MAKRQVLFDAILVRWVDCGRAREAAAAFGILGLQEMPFAGARPQDLASGRNLETFGRGLFSFNAFGTSHKSIEFLQKERAIYGAGAREARGFLREDVKT